MHRSCEWLFERIRRAHREQGPSGRELAARFKVSRRTVRQAIESPVPLKRKSPPPRPSGAARGGALLTSSDALIT
ncbi:HTH domain-containing protein [Kitasatospora cystarginea]|uniref:HTH domain-containing protein n=1 Tax=Kitasatospora TaxID=2063 RepID=UPI003CD09804